MVELIPIAERIGINESNSPMIVSRRLILKGYFKKGNDMLGYKQCKELIEQEIIKLELDKQPTELYDPIKYILTLGGKRIRPSLLLMACNLFKDDISQAIGPAMAIEVFHNFTLLHDDIMDNAVLRRNKPVVHLKWNSNIAILSGDAMMIKAYDLLTKTDKDKLPNLLEEFTKVAIEVCEGQQFDMNFEKTINVTVDEYINMIRLKTSVLIASSLKMGAILGGASKKDTQLIYDFGLNLGIGFQLQDDLLDTYGDSATFGKKIGGDIVANKKTFLLTTALSLAKDETYIKLKKLITTYEYSREEKVELIKGIYDLFEIKSLTEQKINEYFVNALSCLNQVSVDKKRLEKINEVVSLLTNRYS